jgi:hypothetical protein
VELVLRFVVGGLVVSAFAALADILKPKSFAGLFAAAPSIALATLALTAASNGKAYAAEEARSMIGGGAACLVYAFVCMQLMARRRWTALRASTFSLLVWFGVAFSLWLLVLR